MALRTKQGLIHDYTRPIYSKARNHAEREMNARRLNM